MKTTEKQTLSAPSESIVSKIVKNPYLRYCLFGLIIALLPQLPFVPVKVVTILGGAVIYAVVGMGLNMLLGYSGLISLGTAGFMGLGAYVSGYLTKNMDMPFLVALVVALVVACFIGVLVGLVSLRVAGVYLGIATLCVSEILRKTFEELDEFTNGFSGFNASYPTIFGMELSRTGTFVLLCVVLVLIMMLTHNLVNGQVGRAMHAMRGSEVAAQAMGINLLKYRLLVFAIASAYAALGGVLYMHFIKFSYPSTWVLMLSLNILAVVVIGGLRSIYGTVLGAFIVYAVPDLLLKEIDFLAQIDGLPYIFSGVLIILVIMFYPNGVVNLSSDFKRLIRFLIGKLKGGAGNE